MTLAASARRCTTRIRWCLVLAEDAEEATSLQCLQSLLDSHGLQELEVRLAFADLQPTDRYFHASWAKNTSHQFALRCIGSDCELHEHILVNLDCDIVLPPRFSESVLSKFRSPALQLLGCRGAQPATNGRLAIRASAFVGLGGYDQEPDIYGSGYQDIDLRDRVRIAPFPHNRGVVKACFDQESAADPSLTGWALPNTSFDFATTHEDRNLAKMTYVYNPHHLTWGDMNEANRDVMMAKQQRAGSAGWKRNAGLEQLGWPFIEVPLDCIAHVLRNPGRLFDRQWPLFRGAPAHLTSPAEPTDSDHARATRRLLRGFAQDEHERRQAWLQKLNREAAAWLDHVPEDRWGETINV